MTKEDLGHTSARFSAKLNIVTNSIFIIHLAIILYYFFTSITL